MGGLNGSEGILLASGGTIVLIVLLLASYFTGHHNARHGQAASQPSTRPKGEFDPAFILQAIEDGVVMIDAQGVLKLLNPAAANIIGRSGDESTGLDFHNILQIADEHGKPYDANDNPFDRALATNQTIRDSKSLLVTTRGKQVPISLIISPVSTTTPEGIIAVFRDITREKAEEEERNEFISTASHEMRTPIASIEGYLSLVLNAKTTKIDPDSRTYLEKAHKATEHLGQLFQDLLTTTKAEDSRLASHPEPTDVGEVLASVVEEVKPAAEKKSLSLHFLTSAGESAQGKVVRPIFRATADPERLKEVFRNLLDNAIKYTSAGSITVRLTGDKSIVQVQVSDTGTGIPADDIPHLFQKFYRVDSSLTREVGGTGLGLFICRKILDLYSGKIWVESQAGKGSTFFVNLPRLDNSKLTSSNSISSVVKST